MGKIEIETINSKLIKELSYEFMKNMTRDEYFTFAREIFNWLKPYKDIGLTKDDIFNVVNQNIYHTQSKYMDTHEVFGIRLEILLNELIDYCDLPSFWNDKFEIYLKKWDEYYLASYIE